MTGMAFFALRGRLLPDGVAGYREAHDRIPQAVLEGQRAAGLRRWLIFQDGLDTFHLAECDDFDASIRSLEANPVDREWQRVVAPFKQPLDASGTTERRLELIYERELWLPDAR